MPNERDVVSKPSRPCATDGEELSIGHVKLRCPRVTLPLAQGCEGTAASEQPSQVPRVWGSVKERVVRGPLASLDC